MPPERFQPDLLAGADEPVRRWFAHAIREGAPLDARVEVGMRGRIKAGAWLPFTATETVDARSFEWRARAGPLRVVDRYADGSGATEGRLFGRLRVFRADDENTARSAAGRTALEAVVFAPQCVLPGRGVEWRAEEADLIVARFDLPPERLEVRIRIDERGAARAVSAERWGDAGGKRFAYIPCGCEVRAERRFGDLVLPSEIEVGWRFGTPRYEPFFRATVTSVGGRRDE